MAELEFVHRFVPSSGSPLTVLLLHGTGGTEDDLIQLGRDLAPQAALLSPRGRVLENGTPRFFRRFPDGDIDIQDLSEQTHALARFVAAAAKKYRFQPDGVVAVGYSSGANIAGSTLILHPETLAGAVLIRGMVPFATDDMPDLSGKPILILAGSQDETVPMNETERLASMLEAAGAEVKVRLADASHAITGEDMAAAKEWLASSFGGRPA